MAQIQNTCYKLHYTITESSRNSFFCLYRIKFQIEFKSNKPMNEMLGFTTINKYRFLKYIVHKHFLCTFD